MRAPQLLATMTTVGYGDFTPQTGPGKVLTGISMVVGLLCISMPLAIVGNNFTDAWDSRTLALISERLRQKMMVMGNLGGAFSSREQLNAFRVFDRNGNGFFSYRTFKKILDEELNLRLSNWRLRQARRLRHMIGPGEGNVTQRHLPCRIPAVPVSFPIVGPPRPCRGAPLPQAWKLIDSDESNMVDFYEFASAFYPEMDEDEVGKAMKELQPYLQQGVVQGHMNALDDESNWCRRTIASKSGTMQTVTEAVLEKARGNVRAMGGRSVFVGGRSGGTDAAGGGGDGAGGAGGVDGERLARIEESLNSVVELQSALMKQMATMQRSMEAMAAMGGKPLVA